MPYILPVFPPLALLIGRYLSASWESRDFPGVRTGYGLFLAVALLLAGASLAVPYYRPANDVQTLGLYRYTFALTLAVGASVAFVLARYRGFRQAFVAAAVTSVLFLVQANAAAPRVDTKSIKNLAITLKPLLKPGAEVASCKEYYQDLPVYLEQRITVVDWNGELDFGRTVEDTSGWMIDSAEFRKRWQGPSPMYAVMEIKNYDILRNDPHLTLFPIAQTRRNVLLSNREVKQ